MRDTRPVRATLHFIYGLPGAGKTSLARDLASRLPAVAIIEDEWLAALNDPITSFEAFVAASRRARAVIGPLTTRLLALGTSVVFDFAGNTVAHRAWARSLADAAGAAHVLHVIEVPLDECKRRVRERNAAKPEGLFYGEVAEALVDAVARHVVPPSPDEGLTLA